MQAGQTFRFRWNVSYVHGSLAEPDAAPTVEIALDGVTVGTGTAERVGLGDYLLTITVPPTAAEGANLEVIVRVFFGSVPKQEVALQRAVAPESAGSAIANALASNADPTIRIHTHGDRTVERFSPVSLQRAQANERVAAHRRRHGILARIQVPWNP